MNLKVGEQYIGLEVVSVIMLKQLDVECGKYLASEVDPSTAGSCDEPAIAYV